MTNVAKSPVYAYRSSAVIAAADAPTGSAFDDWSNKVQKKLDQTIREAVSHVGEGPVVKPHWSVKVIGIAEAGTTVFKVIFGSEDLPTLDQVVGDRVAGIINPDQSFGFQLLTPQDQAKIIAQQRAQFNDLVAEITATASQAGVSNVIPVWLSDPKAPVRNG